VNYVCRAIRSHLAQVWPKLTVSLPSEFSKLRVKFVHFAPCIMEVSWARRSIALLMKRVSILEARLAQAGPERVKLPLAAFLPLTGSATRIHGPALRADAPTFAPAGRAEVTDVREVRRTELPPEVAEEVVEELLPLEALPDCQREPVPSSPVSCAPDGAEQLRLDGDWCVLPDCVPEAPADVADPMERRMLQKQFTDGVLDDRFVVPGSTAAETRRIALDTVRETNKLKPETTKFLGEWWLRQPFEVRRLALSELDSRPRHALNAHLCSHGHRLGLQTSVVVDPGAPHVRSGPSGGEADTPASGPGAKEPDVKAIAASIWAAPPSERRARLAALPTTVKAALSRHMDTLKSGKHLS